MVIPQLFTQWTFQPFRRKDFSYFKPRFRGNNINPLYLLHRDGIYQKMWLVTSQGLDYPQLFAELKFFHLRTISRILIIKIVLMYTIWIWGTELVVGNVEMITIKINIQITNTFRYLSCELIVGQPQII